MALKVFSKGKRYLTFGAVFSLRKFVLLIKIAETLVNGGILKWHVPANAP